MELTLSTPALLFPAISLLLLAYTNRFLALTKLIRDLHDEYLESKEEIILRQIKSLRQRLSIIRNMQACGVLAFLFCVVCMFFLFNENKRLAEILFQTSLLLMMISLLFSIWEIQISTKALSLELQDIEDGK